MIEVSNLAKSFGDVQAVAGVNFEAKNGCITGLLGPNGAGKSTTLRMLYGLVSPDAGSVYVDRIDVHKNRLAAQQKLGVMPDAHGLYGRLTAREHIEYFGRLHGVPEALLSQRTTELLRMLDMMTTRAVRELILTLKSNGIAVVFSSHLMHEVARLCDHIVIVSAGKVIAEGTKEQIREAAGEENLEDAFVMLVEKEYLT